MKLVAFVFFLVTVSVMSCAKQVVRDEVPTQKREAPPPLVVDSRPIDHAQFNISLNERHDKHGSIYASVDGGCHVYPDDDDFKSAGPGDFPPPRPVPCPESMLSPEWGYCTEASSLETNASRTECVCSPGNGDPPGPSFRVPCPTR